MPVTTQVGTSVAIAAATNAGTPIVTGDPRHASSVAIRQLASALTGLPVAPPSRINGETVGSQAGKRRGLFRRSKGSRA